MKIIFKALFIASCIVASTVNAESLRGARQLQINFAGGNELASPLRIGEEVLTEVNDKLREKVSGKKLLAIAENVQNHSVSPENGPIAEALKEVIQKLYPSEPVESILSHVVPALQAEASTEKRQLQINFSSENQLASPMRIGEEVLAEVNDKLVVKVSGKKLLEISERVQKNDSSVSTSPETATIVSVLKDVIQKLYPNESIDTILSHVVPALQEQAKQEQ